MVYPDVKVALCRCKEGRRPFGVRFEEYENNWMATWSFTIKKEGADQREHYDKTKLKGMITWRDDYPGCPYCGGMGFVVCGVCGGLNCNMNENHEEFICEWCGTRGAIIDYDGGGFNAGSDR